MNKLKILALILVSCLAFGVAGCGGGDKKEEVVYVYSWGDYLNPEVLNLFEEETGIHVILDEFDTNESMYPRVAEGAVHYDVLCPSDYMIQKLVSNDLIQPLDFNKLPDAKKNIGEEFFKQCESFDPGNKYSVPYCWGTVGIIYDKTKVTDPVDSWNILWNEKYAGQILMQDSARDAMMIPLKLMGKSLNETDKDVLAKAQEMLKKQKPLVQAYVVDEVKDKLINSEAAMGVVFSGEAPIILKENPNMDFVIPKEGTNFWIDGWVVTKDAQNVDNAHKFIDFMCRPDASAENFRHLGYSTPNTAVKEQVEEELGENVDIAFPPEEIYEGQESYRYLGEELDKIYTKIWLQVKVS